MCVDMWTLSKTRHLEPELLPPNSSTAGGNSRSGLEPPDHRGPRPEQAQLRGRRDHACEHHFASPPPAVHTITLGLLIGVKRKHSRRGGYGCCSPCRDL